MGAPEHLVNKASIDVIKSLRDPYTQNMFRAYNQWLQIPDELRVHDPRNSRAGRLRNLSKLAEEKICQDVEAPDLTGNLAIVSGIVYSEVLLRMGRDAEDYFQKEEVVFSGVTIQQFYGRERALLHFFRQTDEKDDSPRPTYYARPQDIDFFEITHILTDLRKRAESCRDFTLNSDFLLDGAEGQLDAIIKREQIFGEGLPTGPCQIETLLHFELHTDLDEEGVIPITGPSRLRGILHQPVFAELLLDPLRETSFSQVGDFQFGQGAPCLFVRDLHLQSLFYIIPVDPIRSLRLTK